MVDEVYCNICDTQMEWVEDENQWVCPACGNCAFENNGDLYFEHSPNDDYEEYYDPEDMSPDKDGFDPDDFNK